MNQPSHYGFFVAGSGWIPMIYQSSCHRLKQGEAGCSITATDRATTRNDMFPGHNIIYIYVTYAWTHLSLSIIAQYHFFMILNISVNIRAASNVSVFFMCSGLCCLTRCLTFASHIHVKLNPCRSICWRKRIPKRVQYNDSNLIMYINVHHMVIG